MLERNRAFARWKWEVAFFPGRFSKFGRRISFCEWVMSAGWAAGLWGLSWAFSRVTAGVVGAYPRVIAGANEANPWPPGRGIKRTKKKRLSTNKNRTWGKKTQSKIVEAQTSTSRYDSSFFAFFPQSTLSLKPFSFVISLRYIRQRQSREKEERATINLPTPSNTEWGGGGVNDAFGGKGMFNRANESVGKGHP